MLEKLLIRGCAKKLLGKYAILTIHPSAIVEYADTPFYEEREQFKQKVGKSLGTLLLHSFYIRHSLFSPEGDWDLKTSCIKELHTYQMLENLWQHRDDFHQSIWYQQALQRFEAKCSYKHKREKVHSKEQLDLLFEQYLLALLKSMKTDGYNSTLSKENPRIVIGRDGKLLKSRKGRHRFSAAHIVGAQSIVVEIDNIHPKWLQKIDGGFFGEKLKNTQNALAQLEALNQKILSL